MPADYILTIVICLILIGLAIFLIVRGVKNRKNRNNGGNGNGYNQNSYNNGYDNNGYDNNNGSSSFHNMYGT